jgi:AcrR family transcriptional regulator
VEEHQLRTRALPDKAAHSVRHHRSNTEDDVTPRRQQVRDRRVQRTQKVLRDALHGLIREKSYDSIAVQEILDRANVGRSTFYTHYRDKDELLVSGIHDILDPARASVSASSSAGGHERILSFSLPILEHIDRHQRAGEGRMGARGRAVLHGHLRRVLAELITDDLREDLRGRGKATSTVPSNLLVQYVASTFVLVLNWWVESRSRLPPGEVNDLFRALVLPALAASEG